jgi:ribonuclease VapC
MRLVLDASAVIAHLFEEIGGDKVFTAGNEFHISTVNVSEVADYFAREGFDRTTIETALIELPFEVHPLTIDVAIDAAMMRPDSKPFGLSLGDRCCLSLAKRLNCPVVTAEKIWPRAGHYFGIEIILIR